jgi:GxxExxY protein
MELNQLSSKVLKAAINVHKKQLLTYLRLAQKPLGLLLNFNECILKDGISRIINTTAGADLIA